MLLQLSVAVVLFLKLLSSSNIQYAAMELSHCEYHRDHSVRKPLMLWIEHKETLQEVVVTLVTMHLDFCTENSSCKMSLLHISSLLLPALANSWQNYFLHGLVEDDIELLAVLQMKEGLNNNTKNLAFAFLWCCESLGNIFFKKNTCCNGERKLDLDLLWKRLLIVAQSFALGSPARSSGIISRITKTAAATNLPRTVSLLLLQLLNPCWISIALPWCQLDLQKLLSLEESRVLSLITACIVFKVQM